MTTVDELWFLAGEARQRAEQSYHRLCDSYGDFMEVERERAVSRRRFRRLADRVRETGAPFGAHTIVYREAGKVLLVRHDGVDLWVLPGGEVRPAESYREAAERELAEEAGVEARYDGLAIVTRVEVLHGGRSLWGVVPVFAAEAVTTEPTVADPDGEISRARRFGFDDLPSDTRDRAALRTWRERCSP